MILRKWEDLPDNMKNNSIVEYYNILDKKRLSLLAKRLFDFVVGLLIFIILLPLFMILGITIKLDSKGPIIFRQVRVTQYGRQYYIYKFRTMIDNAESSGPQITTKNDMRITKIGRFLRRYRLDEIPQIINIISGDMTFVGTRPEVLKYVEQYTNDMIATLLLPAGVTSEASIQYKDEERLLADATNIDDTYLQEVLPHKMAYNLQAIRKFSFVGEIGVMIRTILAVVGKDSSDTNASIQKDRKKCSEYAKIAK